MKKLMIAALAAGVMLAGGCGAKKNEGCKPGSLDPKCDRCTTEYCKYIGSRLADPRVVAGEEVKYEDGTVIRPVAKDKIKKWETFEEMNPQLKDKPAATPAAAPAAAPVAAPAAGK